ncbi:DUF6445 family protein [Cellvibrio sp. NN19]|uniref:DUF6445 family protein n=1 Tax=Cellvibrio chitinivorans TaxID=3102792 RepID=UPI002B41026C|nr:DUF6445 family protein [Cellvibrio sp. NN19]
MQNDNFLPPLHPQFSFRVDHVGNEKTPVLIIDNFLHQAEALLGFAVKFGDFHDGTDFYPGIQSKVPEFYSQALQTYLPELICNAFNITRDHISHSQSMYSMVLTPPAKLAPPQSRPHVDTIHKQKLACVHYLCTPEKGGTSLYRHKATGFESLSPERMDEYADYLEQEAKDTNWQKKYINGSNQYYEEIGRYEANINRLIMYPGDVLHSASIPENFQFRPNPIIGRLTLNSFIYLK